MAKETIPVEGTMVAETDRAILVDVDGEEMWFPLSQCDVDYREGDTVMVFVPEWLARKLDLI